MADSMQQVSELSARLGHLDEALRIEDSHRQAWGDSRRELEATKSKEAARKDVLQAKISHLRRLSRLSRAHSSSLREHHAEQLSRSMADQVRPTHVLIQTLT
jgi:hypothetical protein